MLKVDTLFSMLIKSHFILAGKMEKHGNFPQEKFLCFIFTIYISMASPGLSTVHWAMPLSFCLNAAGSCLITSKVL